MNFIENYKSRIKSYSQLRYIFESSFIAILGKFILAIFILSYILLSNSKINVNNLPKPDFLKRSKTIFLFFKLCIFAPAVETIVAQWLPITILNKMTSNALFIIWLDALLFSLAHWPTYGFIRMLTVLPVGLILAWSFFSNKDSFIKAFYLTASIHSLCNIILYLLN